MNENSIGISLVICCYNSVDKIPTTLKYLAVQIKSVDIKYELILVDNNCSDDTTQVAIRTWSSYGNPFPFRIVKQPKAGLTYARQMGIQSSSFEYIILCDDDNWLCDDYLKKTFNLFEKFPDAALIGGVGEAVFETTPPKWFKKVNGFGYAVGNEEASTGLVAAVYGAGMGIRKSIFQKLITNETLFILSDRKGHNLSSGGDTEICMIFRNNGYKIYLDSSLTFKHFLTSDRLNWKYYLKLRRSFGKANAYLQLYNNELVSGIRKKNRAREFSSLVKFILTNWKYIVFPAFYQNAYCAEMAQQLSMRYTRVFEFKKINTIAKQMTLVESKTQSVTVPRDI
ncbi:MAG: glycosyltransferase [Ferruginibacter sp.]